MEVGEATRFRILTPKRIQAFKIIILRVMKMKNNLVHLPLSKNNFSSSSINLMFNPNKNLKINRTSNSKTSRKKVLTSLINYHTVTQEQQDFNPSQGQCLKTDSNNSSNSIKISNNLWFRINHSKMHILSNKNLSSRCKMHMTLHLKTSALNSRRPHMPLRCKNNQLVINKNPFKVLNNSSSKTDQSNLKLNQKISSNLKLNQGSKSQCSNKRWFPSMDFKQKTMIH